MLVPFLAVVKGILILQTSPCALLRCSFDGLPDGCHARTRDLHVGDARGNGLAGGGEVVPMAVRMLGVP